MAAPVGAIGSTRRHDRLLDALGALLGFALVDPDALPPELDALVVEPAAMEGRRRPAAARARLRRRARRIGESRSPSTGRVLPRMLIGTG